ncbi:MAG: hypothetical protein NT067_03890 [Candidatus Diapherotrites archaeon]|nr:hypothetical protein [Candidatus Diapherotrites archaeon]
MGGKNAPGTRTNKKYNSPQKKLFLRKGRPKRPVQVYAPPKRRKIKIAGGAIIRVGPGELERQRMAEKRVTSKYEPIVSPYRLTSAQISRANQLVAGHAKAVPRPRRPR